MKQRHGLVRRPWGVFHLTNKIPVPERASKLTTNKSVIPRLQWPKPVFKSKRAITAAERAAIVGRELNAERRDFYELLWHTGASQTDAACLMAEDVDWNQRTISYSRRKLESRGRQSNRR